MQALLMRQSIALAAAAALWAFLVNRIILHWVDAPIKALSEITLALGLAGLASWSAWRPAFRHSTWAALTILGLFSAGEINRIMLRSEYGRRFEVPTLSQVWNPVTTTELSVQRFSIDVAALGTSRVRVVHVSDLHVTDALPWSYFETIEGTIRELAPDVIVMTGDYVSEADRIGLFARWLATLPKARFGAFATLGNHDYWTGAPEEVRAALRNAGVRVIGGACETVGAGAAALHLCGTDEPWGPALDRDAMKSDGLPVLALTHSPDNIYALRDLGVTAVFAGHTHGGQIRLPGLGALIVPSRYGRRFEHLFVSAGLGADAPPLRLWCPPELLAVDLIGKDARLVQQ
jgi:predicted MPP superfamily phosphohydrolase